MYIQFCSDKEIKKNCRCCFNNTMYTYDNKTFPSLNELVNKLLIIPEWPLKPYLLFYMCQRTRHVNHCFMRRQYFSHIRRY